MDDGATVRDGGWVVLSLALGFAERHDEPPPPANTPVLVERFLTASVALDGR